MRTESPHGSRYDSPADRAFLDGNLPDPLHQCGFAGQVPFLHAHEEHFIGAGFPEVVEQGGLAASRCALIDAEHGLLAGLRTEFRECPVELIDFIGPARKERRGIPVPVGRQFVGFLPVESHGGIICPPIVFTCRAPVRDGNLGVLVLAACWPRYDRKFP